MSARVPTLLAGLALSAIATGASPGAARSGTACGVRVTGVRIVGPGGRTLYREPGHWSPGYRRPHVVRCSGSSVWVVWDNGVASNQEGYVGVHSADGGRTWKLVFAESYFGVTAPHELDAYLGPWTLRGPRHAYFTGRCPACGRGTVSLWVTADSGKTFRRYAVPALTGYVPTRIRAWRRAVTIWATRFATGVPPRRTVTVHLS